MTHLTERITRICDSLDAPHIATAIIRDLGWTDAPSSMRPLHDSLIIIRDQAPNYSDSATNAKLYIPPDQTPPPKALEIPLTSRTPLPTGTVLAIGPDIPRLNIKVNEDGKHLDIPSIQPGDRILFGNFAGTEHVGPDGRPILIITYPEVLCILTEPSKAEPTCPCGGTYKQVGTKLVCTDCHSMQTLLSPPLEGNPTPTKAVASPERDDLENHL